MELQNRDLPYSKKSGFILKDVRYVKVAFVELRGGKLSRTAALLYFKQLYNYTPLNFIRESNTFYFSPLCLLTHSFIADQDFKIVYSNIGYKMMIT